ncbi:HEPN domain-containing protein [Flavobacterium johnsoniae]|uniref:HEPN domain-containing protein n=1 Tax=Flavobacterium johnsoniae TaxID=986 RepID=UPI0025AF43CD|nr:HEPN domain-containing protein [Flavobacterium johnsoniae]WJS94129.1 HEPN domain-containing protein [Flavobacterium johnsoniae]
MLPKLPIETLLVELVTLYDTATDNSHKIYYSKLALIELCGWIELCIDDITKKYIDLKLLKTNNINLAKKQFVDGTYGFEYDKNLRPILIKLIGIINVEPLEDILDYNGDFTLLKSQLNSLISLRNPAAHTSIAGVTHTYQAPSTMLTYLNSIYDKLGKLETGLNMI